VLFASDSPSTLRKAWLHPRDIANLEALDLTEEKRRRIYEGQRPEAAAPAL